MVLLGIFSLKTSKKAKKIAKEWMKDFNISHRPYALYGIYLMADGSDKHNERDL
jgi:hypothetical protein